jgi:REP-associated tyrosine transposase
MSTLSNLLVHLVFSTKGRTQCITKEIRDELYPYMGGIICELGGRAMAVGGTKDHIHMLVRIPHSASVSDFVRVLKTNSSRWIHEKWKSSAGFAWQEGYGAFSISASNAQATTEYILQQEKHHGKKSFREEFLEFLQQNDIQYSEKFLWN